MGCAHRTWLRYVAIFTQLVNICWSLFKWGLFLLVAVALTACGYLYLRLDDEIRRQVEHKLAGHYRQQIVRVGGARYEKGRGITVYDLTILEPQTTSVPQPLISIEEMSLTGDIRMEELLTGKPRIDKITLRSAHLHAVRQPDGIWNIHTLLPLPHFSDQAPNVALENASVTFEDSSRPGSPPLTLRDVDLKLTPMEPAPGSTCAHYHVEGTIGGLPARQLSLSGELGSTDGMLDLTFNAIALEITPELLATLPGIPPGQLEQSQISGRANLTLEINRAAVPGATLDWSASATLDRGRVENRMLPQPLSDLSLTIEASRQRLCIKQLTGKCGTADIVLACDRNGWCADAPLGLAARVIGLPVDSHLQAALPESCSMLWERFQPSGKADVEARLAYDGQKWRPELIATCRGVSLTDNERFAYRLEQTTGTVEYKPAVAGGECELKLDLTAIGGGRPIKIQAQLSHLTPPTPTNGGGRTAVAAGSGAVQGITREAGYRGKIARGQANTESNHPVGWFQVSGTDIPLHEALIVALPPKGGQLVRSLHAQGAIDFVFRTEWKDTAQAKADISTDIQLKDCSIQYDTFRYPLQHVQGLVTQRNQVWTLHGLKAGGSNGAEVVCNGQSTPVGDVSRWDLVFQATNVPLDDNLKQSLPVGAQKAWTEMMPQGRVDFTTHVLIEPGQPKPVIEVALRPRERSVSIECKKFPYRFEQLEGIANYQNGRVDLKNLIARHGRTTYSAAEGSCETTPEGGWQFTLRGLNVDWLTSHRDLLAALPPRLQKIIERLQPEGTFALYNSALRFSQRSETDRMATAWDINLDCHQATLHGGIPVENIFGEVHLVGQDDGATSYTAGDLNVQSMIINDIQFTNTRGPLWIDSSLCLFGRPACGQQGIPPLPITADAYGGSLTADVRVEHDGNPRYGMEIELGAIDLSRFVSERLGSSKRLDGMVSGKFSLFGTGRSADTMNGTGELHIVEANIYELPVLVAMLKVLRNRTPDSTAFNRVDAQFGIQGEHIHFQQLNLLGDAVSLYGRGETSLDRKLNLVFYSLVGPADLPIPLWKTIAGQVSQQGLQIKVTGTWDKPESQKDVLPSVNQVIQEIQSGLQAGAATVTPSTAARDAILPKK